MNLIPTFFVGGLGCDHNYFKKIGDFFTKNQEVVFFIPLIHNLESNSVEAQVNNIKSIINENIGKNNKFNLVSYSMGYISILNYYKKYPKNVNKIILISPASVFTRLNKETLDYLIPDSLNFPHIIPLKDTSPDFVNSDFPSVICRYRYIFNYIFILTTNSVYLRKFYVNLYTYLYSSKLRDPEPGDVADFLFSNTLKNNIELVSSNLIKEDTNRLFSSLNKKIDIVIGEKDYYYNYCMFLSSNYKNIILHRVPEGHHTLYFETDYVGSRILKLL